MQSSPRIEELRQKFHENPRRYFAPLANEYRKAGDPEQAIAICRAHLAQQPGHMSGHVVYGQALYDAHRTDEARVVFQQALALDPENIVVLRHLGDIARQSGDAEEARRWYSRALDGDPQDAEVAAYLAELTEPLVLGIAQEDSGAPAPAASQTEPMTETPPPSETQPEAMVAAEKEQMVAVTDRDSSGSVSRATPSTESPPIVTRTMAELYLHQGHLAPALDIYRELAARNPDDAEVRARIEELTIDETLGLAAQRERTGMPADRSEHGVTAAAAGETDAQPSRQEAEPPTELDHAASAEPLAPQESPAPSTDIERIEPEPLAAAKTGEAGLMEEAAGAGEMVEHETELAGDAELASDSELARDAELAGDAELASDTELARDAELAGAAELASDTEMAVSEQQHFTDTELPSDVWDTADFWGDGYFVDAQETDEIFGLVDEPSSVDEEAAPVIDAAPSESAPSAPAEAAPVMAEGTKTTEPESEEARVEETTRETAEVAAEATAEAAEEVTGGAPEAPLGLVSGDETSAEETVGQPAYVDTSDEYRPEVPDRAWGELASTLAGAGATEAAFATAEAMAGAEPDAGRSGWPAEEEPPAPTEREVTVREFFATLGAMRAPSRQVKGEPEGYSPAVPESKTAEALTELPAADEYEYPYADDAFANLFGNAPISDADSRAAAALSGAVAHTGSLGAPAPLASAQVSTEATAESAELPAQESEDDIRRFREWLDGLTDS